MDEYEALGHMKPSTTTKNLSYFIPHFHVLNPGSTTTSFRVVFDASAATENGISLNDILMVGPNIQRDLYTHLVVFRCKAVAITGDISKMYRQMLVAQEDRPFQKILWGDSNETKTFELATITYETASASFLATRVLQFLADQETELKVGAAAIRDNMYVDDLIAAADTVEEALQIYDEVTKVLAKGQLPIRKFCSNSAEVMSRIPRELHGQMLKVGEKDLVKALGMLWDPTTDFLLCYHEIIETKTTKRAILSQIGTLFDPVGIVSPVTVLGKMFMQELWAAKLAWDESLPQSLATTWHKIRSQLPEVNRIKVPRLVLVKGAKFSIHGFADASKRAYAAALYISSLSPTGVIETHLLTSKTKVAPLKTVTLPRLELLGALLLSRLLKKVRNILPFTYGDIFLWLDASIALTWIKASPHRWTDFVATRVTEIQATTHGCHWQYVPTEQNPADIASRGMLPHLLAESSLWFRGPKFLQMGESHWPKRFNELSDVPEMASQKQILIATCVEKDLVESSKYHSWLPLQRVFGYVARYVDNLRSRIKTNRPKPTLWKKGDSLPPRLDTTELDEGLCTAIRIIQHAHFKEFFQSQENEKKMPKNLSSLHPFVDSKNIIRVGGRLSNAKDISDATKYPIILPPHHTITKSLFLYTHAELMHAGPRATMGYVYREYWPLQGKTLANRIINQCLRCKWIKPVAAEQIMGSLPEARASRTDRPFLYTGVDFFEPLWIAQTGRGRKPVRAYGAVFVCFSTKAIHIELVDDLTTSGFLSAMTRFVGRRGCPAHMYSDNGRNFVGARNALYNWQEDYDQNSLLDWCGNVP